MQRLHEDDLTGHLIAQQGWEQVSIPAEAERDEVWKFPVSKRVHERKIIDALRNELSGIVAISVQGSKEARAQAAAPDLEAGNYWLPRTESAEEFIEECAAFPNAARDDMVDAWSQAACRFRPVYRLISARA